MNRYDIDDMRRLARSHGGLCLSNTYIKTKSKLRWQCSLGHIWETTPSIVLRGGWCPKCVISKLGDHTRIDGLAQANKIARSVGGQCLSDKYINLVSKLSWKCILEHEWSAALSDIKKGTWCPRCNVRNVRERYCRSVMEALFGVSFNKAKLPWLKNMRGHQMEYDGFNKQLGVAFEHHGEYHYTKISFFHRTDEDFVLRQLDDQTKRDLSKQHGIYLIEIPYTVSVEKIKDWIIEDLATQKYLGDINADVEPKIDLHREDEQHLSKLKNIAISYGGKCLSNRWIGWDAKYTFKCASGHIWKSNKIRNKHWCRKCYEFNMLDREGLDKLKTFVQSNHNGECLSTIYMGVNIKHEYKCSVGHIWQACPTDIYKGTWCKQCARSNSLNDTSLQDIANSRGGECISHEYRGLSYKYIWRCSKGHTWEARLGNVIYRNSWCKQCYRDRRSKTYVDSRTIETNTATITAGSSGSIYPISELSNGRSSDKYEATSGGLYSANSP